MTRHLHHLTTSTGHTRRSLREEVSAEALAACRDALRAALAATSTEACTPVPGMAGYTLSAAAEGDALLVTVWRGPAPLVTLGVARSEEVGLTLWAHLSSDGWSQHPRPPRSGAIHLSRGALGVPSLDRPPPAPWCAAVLQPGLALHPEAAGWLGDFERCLAWAWVEGL